MADVANKYPENAAGKFYVDEQCIDCDLCRETAPANLGINRSQSARDNLAAMTAINPTIIATIKIETTMRPVM